MVINKIAWGLLNCGVVFAAECGAVAGLKKLRQHKLISEYNALKERHDNAETFEELKKVDDEILTWTAKNYML